MQFQATPLLRGLGKFPLGLWSLEAESGFRCGLQLVELRDRLFRLQAHGYTNRLVMWTRKPMRS